MSAAWTWLAACQASAKSCSHEILFFFFAKSYRPSDVQHVRADLRGSSISERNALNKTEFVLSGQ